MEPKSTPKNASGSARSLVQKQHNHGDQKDPINFFVNKKIRHTYDTETNTKLEDRLTSLPESLQLHILSTLDAQYVVRTSVLSKSLVSLWKSVPILTLSSYSFKRLTNFDSFVKKVVCQSVNVDTLIFKRGGKSSKKILKKVISYVCSSNVKHLDVRIKRVRGGIWPIFFHRYPDSLKSLKLHSQDDVLCSNLGPGARSFKNLTELYLHKATIHDIDPFSGFRVLNKLTLSRCQVDATSTLNIHSKHLSELSILGAGYGKCVRCVDNEEKMLDNPMMFFMKVYNVKSLKVFPVIVYILGSFPVDLVNRCTHFQDLKSLMLDFGDFHIHHVRGRDGYLTYEQWEDALSNVKDYLLRKSPAAVFMS
ncbi:F-box domain, Leucine-rich repeat domain, L domain-like protein [Artemisia annua]|uniref:F-box domain, Leucine-rich repeat domain, L domain-like protein n=1 Tax=Artemisia annua TaxID=35608 RepID=A0A2U1PCZ5_ARTAN|nr:F-box domain, Leucine-rich repeat domain, L domain-like protein [Artemisia annua]